MSLVAIVSDSILKYLTSEVLRLPSKFDTTTFAWPGFKAEQILNKCQEVNIGFIQFDYVFIEIGTNDVSEGLELETNSKIASDILEFVKKTTFKPRSSVFICSLIPRNDSERYAKKVSAVNRRLRQFLLIEANAQSLNFTLDFFDTRHRFLASAARKEVTQEYSAKAEYLSQKDSLHLTGRGLATFSGLIRHKLKRYDPEAFKDYAARPVDTSTDFHYNKTRCRVCRAVGHGDKRSCERFII